LYVVIVMCILFGLVIGLVSLSCSVVGLMLCVVRILSMNLSKLGCLSVWVDMFICIVSLELLCCVYFESVVMFFLRI